MSEEEKTPFSLDGIRRSFNRFIYGAGRAAHEVDLALDRDSEAAKKRLLDVNSELEFLVSPENSPRVIQIKTSKSEYTSIRRVEGQELERRIENFSLTTENDPFNTIFQIRVPPQSLDEGQVLVFDLPTTFDHIPKTKDLTEKISEKLGDKLEDFANFIYLATVCNYPELIKTEDWEPANMYIDLVTKSGGKLYAIRYFKEGQDSRADAQLMNFRRLDVDSSGTAFLQLGGFFQSDQDIATNREYIRKYGRVYTLVEGSSEKESKKSLNTVLQPHPSLAG